MIRNYEQEMLLSKLILIMFSGKLKVNLLVAYYYFIIFNHFFFFSKVCILLQTLKFFRNQKKIIEIKPQIQT